MKRLQTFLCFILFFSASVSNGQSRDTVEIRPGVLSQQQVRYGTLSYIVFNKKAPDSAATGLYLVDIEISPMRYRDQSALAIRQRWDARDTIAHTAYTVLKSSDFSTLWHETTWMRSSYSTAFDFVSHKLITEGKIADSVKSNMRNAFDRSFENYNLNWHADLVLFTLLPYAENRTFKINFYDPGFGMPQTVCYDITGSGRLRGSDGKMLDCWIMEFRHAGADYQRFWITKDSPVVVKEEDYFGGKFRYKYLLELPVQNKAVAVASRK